MISIMVNHDFDTGGVVVIISMSIDHDFDIDDCGNDDIDGVRSIAIFMLTVVVMISTMIDHDFDIEGGGGDIDHDRSRF